MTAAQVRAVHPHDHTALLALNNADASALSWLTPDALASLLQQAWHARVADPADALLIALDQHAIYANANFAWMAARFARFVYVDRIVVAAHTRRRGLATQLYDELIRDARTAGHKRLVCEVNLLPANPTSLALHRQLGFQPIGESVLESGKRVQYLEKAL